MIVYVDESGNLGKDGRYFVVAALVPRNKKRVQNLVRHAYVRYCKENDVVDPSKNPLGQERELKASRLKFPQQQDFLLRLTSKDDFDCSYIVADKKHLQQKILRDKNICYNYLAGFLLKPILRGSSENVHIIFDNHTTKVTSINSLADYIKIEAYSSWNFEKELRIEYQDSKNFYNLQAVDVLANTVYGRYNYNKTHLYNLLATSFAHRVRFPYQHFGR